MATIIMSMAARSSDLEDRRSGANLQTEGHMGVESQCQKDPEETGEMGSSPSTCHLGSQAEGFHPTALILGTA